MGIVESLPSNLVVNKTPAGVLNVQGVARSTEQFKGRAKSTSAARARALLSYPWTPDLEIRRGGTSQKIRR
eukprot:gene10401-biopygen3293